MRKNLLILAAAAAFIGAGCAGDGVWHLSKVHHYRPLVPGQTFLPETDLQSNGYQNAGGMPSVQTGRH